MADRVPPRAPFLRRLLRWRLGAVMVLVAALALGLKGAMVVRDQFDIHHRRRALQNMNGMPGTIPPEPDLIAALADPPSRPSALWALDRIKSTHPAQVPYLVDMLEVDNLATRQSQRWDPHQFNPAYALIRCKLPAAEVCHQLRWALVSPDAYIKHQARRVLVEAALRPSPPSPALVPQLLKILGDWAPDLRGGAVAALAGLGPAARSQAAALLLAQLRGNDRPLQLLAAINLTQLDPEGQPAVALLVNRLADPAATPTERIRDLFLLGRLGPVARPAVPAIVGAMTAADRNEFALWPLNDFFARDSDRRDRFLSPRELDPSTSSTIRSQGVLTLARLGPESERAAIATFTTALTGGDDEPSLRAFEAACALGPPTVAAGALPLLIAQAERPPADPTRWNSQPVWRKLVALLGVCSENDPRYVALIRRMLVSESGPHRCAAAQILSHHVRLDANLVVGLLAELHSPIQGSRFAAATALGRATGPDRDPAVAGLVAALKDRDKSVRLVVVRSLAQQKAAVGPTLPVAEELLLRAPDNSTRALAAQALGEFGPAARLALPALRQARTDSSAMVRNDAAEAIAAIEGTPPPALEPTDGRGEGVFERDALGQRLDPVVAGLIVALSPDRPRGSAGSAGSTR